MTRQSLGTPEVSGRIESPFRLFQYPLKGLCMELLEGWQLPLSERVAILGPLRCGVPIDLT